MKINQTIENAFEALDLEFEILNKAQQQLVMGGSGGSSNGTEYENKASKLVKKMLGEAGYGTGSDGTFDTAGVSDTNRLNNLKSALIEMAYTDEGYDLLQRVSNSGKKIKIAATALSGGSAFYNPNNITNGSYSLEGTFDIGGLEGGTSGVGLAAHEMFHALEDINNTGTLGTINSETQAMIFAGRVEYMKNMYDQNSGHTWANFGNYTMQNNVKVYTSGTSGPGAEFQSAMIDAITNGLDNVEELNYLIDRFKQGSWANRNGLNPGAYDDYDRGTVNVQNGNIQEQIMNFLE